MSEAPTKYLPVSTAETAPYWEGCRRHELLLQRCAACAAYQFYPRVLCVRCSGRVLQWVRASGRGRLKSFTIVRQAVAAAYAAEVPYVVALLELDEGPTMMSNVVDCPLDEIHIGMSVEVIFEDWPEGVSIPKFKPSV